MQIVSIPIILGTIRQGRHSEKVARLVLEHLQTRTDVATELVDIRDIGFRFDDEGEQAKIPSFSRLMAEADGYVLVSPEYNHSYPGSLKMVLDTNFKEYRNKAVGLVVCSNGPWGGVRANENLVNYTQSLGMKPILGSLYFPHVETLFDESGNMLESKYEKRIEKFLDELIELTRKLK